jgi:hypothetical protein
MQAEYKSTAANHMLRVSPHTFILGARFRWIDGSLALLPN